MITEGRVPRSNQSGETNRERGVLMQLVRLELSNESDLLIWDAQCAQDILAKYVTNRLRGRGLQTDGLGHDPHCDDFVLDAPCVRNAPVVATIVAVDPKQQHTSLICWMPHVDEPYAQADAHMLDGKLAVRERRALDSAPALKVITKNALHPKAKRWVARHHRLELLLKSTSDTNFGEMRS